MNINLVWSKIPLALLYLSLVILFIIIQSIVPPTQNGLIATLILFISVAVADLLFVGNLVAAATPPLQPQNGVLSAIAIIIGLVLGIIETIIALRLVIAYIIIIFPKK